MNIHPHLFHHPKYIRLSMLIGREALDHLARLWAFCQQDQRGENLGRVSPEYVEAICSWAGEPLKLWGALTEEMVPGKKGFVHTDRSKNVIVTSWNEHNSSLVSNWRQGAVKKRLAAQRQKSPLPKQSPSTASPLPKQSPSTDGAVVKPSDLIGVELRGLELRGAEGTENPLSPGVESTGRSVEVAWPSKNEWLEFCKLIGLVEWRAEREWLDQERRRPPWKGIGAWQQHANYIRTLWEQDGRPLQPPVRGAGPSKKGAPSAASEKFALRQEKEALEAELAEHVANESCTAFDPQHTADQAADHNKKRARNRELQGLLAREVLTADQR